MPKDAGSTIPKPIKLRPFAGEMGVAPGKAGAFSTIPPYHTGGNIDTKHLTVGSTLYLPIEVDGALFSIGDGHAVQGDGGAILSLHPSSTIDVKLQRSAERPSRRL